MKNKKKSTESPNAVDQPNNYNDGIWTDQRFAHLVSDPRFKNIHKSTKKVKIDKRFESMFKDDKFKLKYTVDKYGRRQSKSQTGSEDLKKYYDLSSDDDEDIEAEQKKEEEEIAKDDDAKDLSRNDSLECDEQLPLSLKDKLKDLSVDYARGDGALWSDDSSDDEPSEDENDELFIEHVWGELDAEAPTTDESTRRLAACNMDWDRIRASDIMVLCHSFLPPSGTILSVTIYPSEFGKERMAEEEIKGPQELTEKKLANNVEDEDLSDDVDPKEDENEEGTSYNMEKLRQYQLNRLKYFYAVIECNSVAAADKLYKECDGLEYESTATKLDLRFIPDDMTFDDEPKDVCKELPDLSKYMPRLYTTTALQQAKVELTWDENDVERKELNEKLISGKLNDVADQELRKFVAYSSEDDSDEEQPLTNKNPQTKADPIDESKSDSISKYKALLNDINEKEKQKRDNRIEMEFSWGVGLKHKPEKSDVDKKDRGDVNHFEKILELKKEKKKVRKEEKKKLRKKHRSGGVDDMSESSDDDLPDGVDLNDPYFAEEFADGDFAEPTDKKKMKNKGKKRIMSDSDDGEKKQKAAELALVLDDGEITKGHFSLKKIQDSEKESKTKKRKKKRRKQDADAEKALLDDDFQINTNDKRFAAVYSSHLYNIDPTDSNFKKTKGMLKLIQTKLSRTTTDDVVSEPNAKKSKKDVAVSLLVKNIKRKTGAKGGK